MREAPFDQASGLRRLLAPRRRLVLAVAGDDAVDVTLNLAAAFSRIGQRVLLLDARPGEAATALGLPARYELAQLLAGERAVRDVLLEGPHGLSVLPARRGLARLGEARADWQAAVSDALGEEAARHDAWLVNGVPPASGLAEPVLLVLSPSPEAITATYGRIKSLAREQGQREFRIVVRRARSESAAVAAYRSVADAARRFLSARLDYCGSIPREGAQSPADGSSPAGHAFSRLAETLLSGAPAALPGAQPT